MPEFRDWGGLPEFPLSDVLRRLLPSLRSIYAFAATCQPWRRLLRASAADLLSPGLPPLLLDPRSRVVVPFCQDVLAQELAYRADLTAEGAILVSVSRGHHLLLRRRRRGASESEARLVIIDALTGAERGEVTLPSPLFAYHYAALSASHLLVFHSKHAFFSTPFPNPSSPSGPGWTKHSLPRSASFVTGVLEFRGRVLGLTDRAQLLELRLGGSPQSQSVQILPAAGLPDATAFDQWGFGPRLAAAGDRLLLVLFMLEPKSGSVVQARRVNKVSVYGLDVARMRWEEAESVGPYSVFVDCAGKAAAACVGVGSCGVEENRIYVACPGSRWRSFPPGWEGSLEEAVFYGRGRAGGTCSSQVWVYPRLLF